MRSNYCAVFEQKVLLHVCFIKYLETSSYFSFNFKASGRAGKINYF